MVDMGKRWPSKELNSTQREFTDAGETPHCPHPFIKIKYKTIKKWLIFGVDLHPGVDPGSDFHLP